MPDSYSGVLEIKRSLIVGAVAAALVALPAYNISFADEIINKEAYLIKFKEGFEKYEIEKIEDILKKIGDKCGDVFSNHPLIFTKDGSISKLAGGDAASLSYPTNENPIGFVIDLPDKNSIKPEQYEHKVAHELWHCKERILDMTELNMKILNINVPLYADILACKSENEILEIIERETQSRPVGFVSSYAKYGFILREEHVKKDYLESVLSNPKKALGWYASDDEAETFAYWILDERHADDDIIVRRKLDAFRKFFEANENVKRGE